MNRSEAKTNRAIGRRLRKARILKDMSLMELGKESGLSFQAIHKHETGASAITAARLMRFARILGIPIGYFFGRAGDSLKTSRRESH